MKNINIILGTLFWFAPNLNAQGVMRQDPCKLPSSIEQRIQSVYPGYHVVQLNDLGPDDQERFKNDGKDSCPGKITLNMPEETVAVLLEKEGKNIVLLFTKTAQNLWKDEKVSEFSGGTAVLDELEPGTHVDTRGEKHILKNKALLVIFYESSVVVYARVDGKIRKFWLAD